ncbi:MAG: helix-turn-helix domain-containing protein [Rhizobiales bacterium]|nr:helix-turn-helix domain-containing protein [Hyphomicrobiales bacterium]
MLKIGKSAAEISRMLGVSRSTISRLKGLARADNT